MIDTGNFGEIEDLVVRIGAGEYLAQILGGIPMSQGEIVRLADLGLSASAVAARITPAVDHLIATGNAAAHRARLVELMRERPDATVGACGLEDTLKFDSARRCANSPTVRSRRMRKHGISTTNTSRSIWSQISEFGVFGLTIPEDYGGMGLGKESMCLVSEELCRGYLGVGSLGTRSEIAAELIFGSGTPAQKSKWLPGIASGEVIPTAVFTEPGAGSDLASLKTRAVRDRELMKSTATRPGSPMPRGRT